MTKNDKETQDDVLNEEQNNCSEDEQVNEKDSDTQNSTADKEKQSEEQVEEEETEFQKLKKKLKPDKKQEALKQKVEELEDRVKRQMAEFENFRKRTEKEKSSMYDLGAKSVIEKILPVVDNFERGLAAVPESEQNSAITEGMNKIYKQLMTELDGLGVKAIEAKGQEFDPNYHNAVMQVESDELESGVIKDELQKGYMYHDIVVRHSMVSVVQ